MTLVMTARVTKVWTAMKVWMVMKVMMKIIMMEKRRISLII